VKGARVFLAILFFCSCVEPRTAVSCSGVNNSGGAAEGQGQDAAKDPHFFKRRKRTSKAQDGFRQKERQAKRSAKKAEKGKKKQRDLTKAEKKWQIFRKKQQGKNDAATKEKRNSAKNERKQKKLNKKRKKHPQMGLFPKGGPG
jgi:hypothetical protein